MCYSLEASITAGIGLGVAGVGMVSKALRSDRRMLLFAAFPLVFSTHQFIEAAVWHTLSRSKEEGEIFRYLYTIIAFAVWPVLTPFAAAHAEINEARRQVWRVLGATGVVLSAYLLMKLAHADGIDVSVVKHSLAYDPLFERPPLIVHFLYIALTVGPLALSERRGVRLFGAVVFATFIFALVENRAAWYSVWCLAAAVFSFVIALAIEEERGADFDELQMQR